MSSSKPLPRKAGISNAKHGASKVSPDHRGCACNWKECKDLTKAFNNMNHPYLSGRSVDVRVNDTNDTLNFIVCACVCIGFTERDKQRLLDDAIASNRRTRKSHTATGQKKSSGRLRIARHHFTIGMWKMKESHESKKEHKKWSWVDTLSEEEVVTYNILGSNFKTDKVVQYDHNKSEKGRNGKKRITARVDENIKYITCATKRDVLDIANKSGAETIASLRKKIAVLENNLASLKPQLDA